MGAGQSAGTATTIATGGGTSIKIRSGGLIISGDGSGGFSNGNGTQTTINPALNFNNGSSVEALINVRANVTGTINGAITSAGLTKFGAGTLAVTAANSLGNSGANTVSVNAGILQTNGPSGGGILNVLGTRAGGPRRWHAEPPRQSRCVGCD